MAFQAGSRVDPRLLDYSGYAQGLTNAAAIEAQAMMQLGEQLSSGIQSFQKKRQAKKLDNAFMQKLENNPEIAMTVLGEAYTDEAGKAFVKDMREGLGEEAYTTVVGQVLFGDLLKEKKEPKRPSYNTYASVLDIIAESDDMEFQNRDGKKVLVRKFDGEEYIMTPDSPFFNQFEGGEAIATMILGDPEGLYMDNELMPSGDDTVSALAKPRTIRPLRPEEIPDSSAQDLGINPIFDSSMF